MADDPQTIAHEKLIAAGFKRNRGHYFHGKLCVGVRPNGIVDAEFVGDDVTVDELLNALHLDKR